MSMDAYRWALTWDNIKPTEKLVLILIADHYNDKSHRAWPSVERLAKQGCMHRSTVMRAIAGLQEAGLIEVEPWVRADLGGQLNNRYCLPLYDPASNRATRLPVVAYASFTNDGSKEYDTFPHEFHHGEKVPGHAAA